MGWSIACIAVVACFFVGCDIPKRPPLSPEDVADLSPPSTSDSGTEDAVGIDGNPSTVRNEVPIDPFSEDWESWDLFFVRGQAVGYNHVVAEGKDGDKVSYRLDNSLYVNQGKARTLQRLIQTSSETRSGSMLEFESKLFVGPVLTTTRGQLEGANFLIETVRGSTKKTKSIAWSPANRGLVAIEQSLRTKPLTEENEVRTMRLLLPGQFEVATAKLRCSGKASVPLMDQSLAELIEINYEVQVDGQPASYLTFWTDDNGAIVRTFSPGINLLSYRTDEATVKAAFADTEGVVEMPIDGIIERPGDAVRVAMTAAPTAASARTGKEVSLQPVPGQWIRDMGDGSFQLLISRKQEQDLKKFETVELEPAAGDTRSNHFVDSGANLVKRYADAALVKRKLTNTEAAIELAQTVKRLIINRKSPGGLVRASEVANDGAGDVTGRSVLLAAMLRARKIPSRLAVGLKYQPPADEKSNPRLVYYVWVLAYADNQWIHLDPTEGGVASADRIALATTDLAGGGNEYESFVPFFNAIGRMDLRVLRAQY
ncbi:Transglutaminase-like superfamily protein [Rubripirellula lacrimiformis]|uniref:Transglutaminase-like superfamily protein n=2 Tax=Rubripirellula lacrimiformis TaxID=1930273 RepID=A0A517N5N6_9BACT|nr:Transglutaminase-like superfamily protein [Rubripirellula lacrimiformis]